MLSTLLSITNSQEEIVSYLSMHTGRRQQLKRRHRYNSGTFWRYFHDEFQPYSKHALVSTWPWKRSGRRLRGDGRIELEESPGRQPNVRHRREKVKQIDLYFALIYDSPSGGRKMDTVPLPARRWNKIAGGPEQASDCQVNLFIVVCRFVR